MGKTTDVVAVAVVVAENIQRGQRAGQRQLAELTGASTGCRCGRLGRTPGTCPSGRSAGGQICLADSVWQVAGRGDPRRDGSLTQKNPVRKGYAPVQAMADSLTLMVASESCPWPLIQGTRFSASPVRWKVLSSGWNPRDPSLDVPVYAAPCPRGVPKEPGFGERQRHRLRLGSRCWNAERQECSVLGRHYRRQAPRLEARTLRQHGWLCSMRTTRSDP